MTRPTPTVMERPHTVSALLAGVRTTGRDHTVRPDQGGRHEYRTFLPGSALDVPQSFDARGLLLGVVAVLPFAVGIVVGGLAL